MIAGGGFAMMAWREAKSRAEVPLLPPCFVPDRGHAQRVGKSSWHYYRITDNATRAAAAYRAAYKLGMVSDDGMKVKL